MALLAEEIVEEWLNRQGYFTIRGIKLGVHEMDLLAVRVSNRVIERRHVEVQASVRPVSYMTRVPKSIQKKTGRGATSAKKRSREELEQGVAEWIHKKYEHPAKNRIRQAVAPGNWTRELVVHRLKYPEEVDLLRKNLIVVHQLDAIVQQLRAGKDVIERAAGGDFVDLVML